jgi:hypothetical protein
LQAVARAGYNGRYVRVVVLFQGEFIMRCFVRMPAAGWGRVVLIGLIVAGLWGCQSLPDRCAAGVDRLTVRTKVRDARAQRIEGLAGLRVDSAAAGYLDAALRADDLPTARQRALEFLRQAQALGQASAANEIRRLDAASVERLRKRYFPSRPTVTRAELIEAYSLDSAESLAAATRRVEAATDAAALRRELQSLRKHVEEPVKYQGRLTRILSLLPFYIPSRIAADHVQAAGTTCPIFLGGFDAANTYRPAEDRSSALARYAPVFVVERSPGAAYDPDADRIGRVAARDREHVVVRTDEPAVYAYARRVLIGDRPHEQLVYVAWFPEHPEMVDDDPMAGHIDGLTVRITLDRESRPAIVDTMANCGCFHGLYPARRLEEAAKAEYGPAEGGGGYALERDAGRKLNAHIPELLEVDEADARPIVYVAAGRHAIVHFGLETVAKDEAGTARYDLRPYEELARLPTPDGGYTSMFYENGLVRHAQRPEGVYFQPLGMLSAGQPRQRETQLIYWDRYDFDDPALLTRLLHLPTDF